MSSWGDTEYRLPSLTLGPSVASVLLGFRQRYEGLYKGERKGTYRVPTASDLQHRYTGHSFRDLPYSHTYLQKLKAGVSEQLCGLTTSALKSEWWDTPSPPKSIWLSFNIYKMYVGWQKIASASTIVLCINPLFYCYFLFAQRISGRALVRHAKYQPSVSEDWMCRAKSTHSSSTGQHQYHRPASPPPCNETVSALTEEWL